jgi:hypothetical protein
MRGLWPSRIQSGSGVAPTKPPPPARALEDNEVTRLRNVISAALAHFDADDGEGIEVLREAWESWTPDV